MPQTQILVVLLFIDHLHGGVLRACGWTRLPGRNGWHAVVGVSSDGAVRLAQNCRRRLLGRHRTNRHIHVAFCLLKRILVFDVLASQQKECDDHENDANRHGDQHEKERIACQRRITCADTRCHWCALHIVAVPIPTVSDRSILVLRCTR